MRYFFDLSETTRKELVPGVMARSVWGEKIMMTFAELAPHSTVPKHAHPHEQMGLVLQGEVAFTIGGETRQVRQGDAYLIPGGVEHSVLVSAGWALLLETFSPPREEYKV